MVVNCLKEALHLCVVITEEHSIVSDVKYMGVCINRSVALKGLTKNPVEFVVENGMRGRTSLSNPERIPRGIR